MGIFPSIWNHNCILEPVQTRTPSEIVFDMDFLISADRVSSLSSSQCFFDTLGYQIIWITTTYSELRATIQLWRSPFEFSNLSRRPKYLHNRLILSDIHPHHRFMQTMCHVGGGLQRPRHEYISEGLVSEISILTQSENGGGASTGCSQLLGAI